MASYKEISSNLVDELEKAFSISKEELTEPDKHTVGLSAPSYGLEEILEALHSLLTTDVTMGEKVKQFEQNFADYIGTKHAIMVNSGSSANLIALSVLANPLVSDPLEPGDEIITPALTWPTTVYPILNVGARPVFVDVDVQSFTLKIDEIDKAIGKSTKAIMPVHLLGIPSNMPKIQSIASANNLMVIEDACEAHGAKIEGKKVGAFGDLATFSFFFSHHINTIEGGMVVTDNDKLANIARSLRAHGWVRDLPDEEREKYIRDNSAIDPKYLFVNHGFNMRPTELQGAFGLHQLPKLEKFIEKRRKNVEYYCNALEKYSDYFILPKETSNTNQREVWFGYPISIKEEAPFLRQDIRQFLSKCGIESRPVMAGNITKQPVANLFEYKQVGDLRNADLIMENSFYFGNHQGITEEDRSYVVECIENFIENVD